MTKKDRRAIIDTLRQQGYGVKTVEGMADVFARTFPDFDHEGFMQAWRWGNDLETHPESKPKRKRFMRAWRWNGKRG